MSLAFTLDKRRQRRCSSLIERQAGRRSDRINLMAVKATTRYEAHSKESRTEGWKCP